MATWAWSRWWPSRAAQRSSWSRTWASGHGTPRPPRRDPGPEDILGLDVRGTCPRLRAYQMPHQWQERDPGSSMKRRRRTTTSFGDAACGGEQRGRCCVRRHRHWRDLHGWGESWPWRLVIGLVKSRCCRGVDSGTSHASPLLGKPSTIQRYAVRAGFRSNAGEKVREELRIASRSRSLSGASLEWLPAS